MSVQNQFSPAFRSSQPELRLCDELGIAFLPYSPLGGIGKAGDLGEQFAKFAPDRRERTGSARSRSRWPGCWPSRRRSSRSRAPAARSRSRLGHRRADLTLTEAELRLISGSALSRDSCR